MLSWDVKRTQRGSGSQPSALEQAAGTKCPHENKKALELDPSLPEGHAMLGYTAALFEYDWKEAERRFRMAMARDPVPVFVRLFCAMSYLLPTGRPAEAVQQIELALQEDPLNILLRLSLANCLIAAGHDEEAAAGWLEILELNPAVAEAQGGLAVLRWLRSWTRRWHIAKRRTPSRLFPIGLDFSPGC